MTEVDDKDLLKILESWSDMKPNIEEAMQLVRSAAKGAVRGATGELAGSIQTDIDDKDGIVTGTCYTDKSYAPFVEFGTGPRGAANHAGISPAVSPAYRPDSWWIHEGGEDDEVTREVAERYGWPYIEDKKTGDRFYHCSGNPAYPFMYPALNDNIDTINKLLANEIRGQLDG